METKQFEFSSENPPSQILSFLYLGDINNATNLRELIELDIVYMLNVSWPQCKDYFAGSHEFKYQHIELYDTANDELAPHLQKCFDFLDMAKNDKKAALVYCKFVCFHFLHILLHFKQLKKRSGKSRSAAIVAAYLMKEYGMDVKDSLLHIRMNRKIMPNEGFITKLLYFEFEMNKKKLMTFDVLENEKNMEEIMRQLSKRKAQNKDPYLLKVLPLQYMVANRYEFEFVNFFSECFQEGLWKGTCSFFSPFFCC